MWSVHCFLQTISFFKSCFTNPSSSFALLFQPMPFQNSLITMSTLFQNYCENTSFTLEVKSQSLEFSIHSQQQRSCHVGRVVLINPQNSFTFDAFVLNNDSSL